MDFIGETIEVTTEGEVKRPAQFIWRGREYHITRIIYSWHDYAIPTQVRKPRFTMRHHRNYYQVETEGGERFEMYFDRGSKRPDWVLLKHLGTVPTSHNPDGTGNR